MTNSALQTESSESQKFAAILERERIHFNKVVVRTVFSDLVIPQAYIRLYENPPADTAAPLEYAFHLLGDLGGKTVVDLGCGDGVNAVILAALGARVISIDVSDKSLELTAERARANGVEGKIALMQADIGKIPIADGSADRVLCAAMLHHVDPVATARQIRRVLKPGGSAAFVEPIAGPSWFMRLKRVVPRPSYAMSGVSFLTPEQTDSVSRAVGRAGRRREFMLTSRILERLGFRPSALRKFHELDAWLLRHFAFTRAFASPLVWEARKEV